MTFLYPDFLLSKSFYTILTGYAMLEGVLRVLDFSFSKGSKTPIIYASMAVGCVMVGLAFNLIVFARHLVHLIPVVLSGLLFVDGAASFVVACRTDNALQKGVLSPPAVATLLGSLTIFVFTFGFGVDGVVGLARVSCGTLLASCVYGMACCLVCHQPHSLRTEGEKRT